MQSLIHKLNVLIDIVDIFHELVPGKYVKVHAFVKIFLRIEFPSFIVLVLSEVNI